MLHSYTYKETSTTPARVTLAKGIVRLAWLTAYAALLLLPKAHPASIWGKARLREFKRVLDHDWHPLETVFEWVWGGVLLFVVYLAVDALIQGDGFLIPIH